MATTLVETVGGASSNTFATEAECDTYCGDRLNASAWNDLAALAETKLQALHEARRTLELMDWKGQRVDSTQKLSWPRLDVPNPDLPEFEDGLSSNTDYASTVVPQRVKDAQCELALQFLKAGTTDLAVADPKDNVKSKQVDVLKTEFFDPVRQKRGLAKHPRILELLRPLLDEAGSGGLSVVRV